MSQDEIYERLLGWMDARLKENENTSRVVFSDKEKGQIVGIGMNGLYSVLRLCH